MSRRVPPTKSVVAQIDDLDLSESVPRLSNEPVSNQNEKVAYMSYSGNKLSVALPSNKGPEMPSFDSDAFSEMVSKPGALEEMMSHMQSNPAAASVISDTLRNPDAKREMTKLIQDSGADLQLMNSMNPRKSKHRGDRPKRKEILKMQKQNKSLLKKVEVPVIKAVKITVSRQINQIELPSDLFPDCCSSRLSTNPDGEVLGFKEFSFQNPGESEKYITVMHIEGSKATNKLIKRTFGMELGREIIMINGTIDQPSDMTPSDFKSLPLKLNLVQPDN